MEILVIGGSYFLGKAFVEQAAETHAVTILNRGSRKVDPGSGRPVTVLQADRHDHDRLRELLAGKRFDAVVDFCAYQEGDIRGVAEVLKDGIRQYVFVSTCDVYRRGTGAETDESGAFETRDFGGEAGAYILGKAALEQELTVCAEQYGFAYTSVRPSFIYGPDNYAPREGLFFHWILQAGQVLYPSDADGVFHMVYVKDVARILLDCCGSREALNQAFNICGDRMGYDGYLRVLEQAVGRPVERVEISVAEAQSRQIPFPFPLTKEESELYSDAKIRKLGVTYTTPEAGMRETFEWYLQTRQEEVGMTIEGIDSNGKIDIEAVLKKVDDLFDENRAKEAEQLLLRSLEAADQSGDGGAKLQILNELIGYYRQTSEREPLLKAIEDALETAERLGLAGTIPYATTTLNAANGYRSIGEIQKSKEYYLITEEIYKQQMPEDDMRMAGLLNNISLLYQELNDYATAGRYLKRALVICEQNKAGFETAVTYANLANTSVMAENYGMAAAYAETAMELFEKRNLFDAHYCAALSALGMCRFAFGRYAEAEALFTKGMELVENTLGQNRQYERLKENRDRARAAMEKAAGGNTVSFGNGEQTGKQKEGSIGGLELCRRYYETFGKQALEKEFAPYLDRIAVGLVGEGSDCFGYDDESSRDHDWGPGFCLWVTEKTYSEIGARLEEMYAGLPVEFMGYTRRVSPQGAKRMGVQTVSGFYKRLLGAAAYEEIDWSSVEDSALAAAVNGEVFCDAEGIFTAFREKLLEGYPERIQYLKLAEDAAKFAQTGEYNYKRMLERGDRMTADRMLCEALEHAMRLAHHMRGLYPPHDKWLYRSCREMAGQSELCELLRKVHTCLKEDDRTALALGVQRMEELGQYLAGELYAHSLISDIDSYLDMHTEELLMKASVADDSDAQLVDRIVRLEFEAFDKVKNEGGRAYCQNDWPTFSVMRKSQYLTWNRTMLLQYLYDFDREYRRGHNLITEKYARMMESTTPEKFREMAENFPELTEQQKAIIDQIVAVQMGMMEEFAEEHPKVAGNARNLHTYEDNIVDTSYETYLRGEISTYSDKMLQLYGQHVVSCMQAGVNIARQIIENTARLYGYENLEKFEASIM